MKESSLKTKKVIIRSLTAVSFLLFIAYQVLVLTQTDDSRIGRIIGIVIFVLITAASFLALTHNRIVKVLRIILLTLGLSANFIIKLTNIPAVFGALDFSQIPSVLNCGVYIGAQLGTIILLAYYLIIRRNSKIKNKRPVTVIFMSLVIALFVLCFIMECVLMFKYHIGINVNLPLTLLSRICYCFGFVGTAIAFMLPPSTEGTEEDVQKYFNKEQAEAEDMVISTQDSAHSSGKNGGRIAAVDDDFMLTTTENKSHSHSDKNRGRIASVDDDFMLMTPTKSKSHSDKSKRHMTHVDDDFMLMTPTKSKSHSDKSKRHMTHVDDDFMLIPTAKEKSHSDKNKNKKRSHSQDDDVLVFSNTESSISRQNKPK